MNHYIMLFPHKIFLDNLPYKSLIHVINHCKHQFGPEHTTWFSHKTPVWFNTHADGHHNLQLYFKHQEDVVMFKLTYTPEDSNG